MWREIQDIIHRTQRIEEGASTALVVNLFEIIEHLLELGSLLPSFKLFALGLLLLALSFFVSSPLRKRHSSELFRLLGWCTSSGSLRKQRVILHIRCTRSRSGACAHSGRKPLPIGSGPDELRLKLCPLVDWTVYLYSSVITIR